MVSESGDNVVDRRTVLQSLGTLGALGVAGATGATPGRDPGPKEGELIVGAGLGGDMSSLSTAVDEETPAGASVTHENERLGYLSVELPEAASDRAREAVRAALQKNPFVDYVEENVTYQTQVAPNDPDFDTQYAPQQVNAPEAWETTYGSEDVSIAVIDTGTQYTHPDLSAQFGSDEGKDFVDDDDDPTNGGGDHATHVCGCASATTDNSEGVAGVANARLISARALDGSGGGSLSDIADAIQWAADQEVDIINMSLGGGGSTETMKNAVSYAQDKGVLIICAAGNDGEQDVSYPAAYSECVAVSAINPDENLADFSNYGSEIEVAAPGVNVLATYPTDDYKELSGTSMACPVASGVAALGKAQNPDMSNSDLRTLLKMTAVDIGLSEGKQGAGRVDAANIVDNDGNYAPSADISVSSTNVQKSDTVDFDGSGSTDVDGSIQSYEWDFGDGTTATGSTASHSYDANGDYTVTLTVTDDAGATGTASVDISVNNLYCGTATISDHVDAGRAYSSWGYYYAEGSDDYLGLSGSDTVTLEETSDGYFEEVSECSGGGDSNTGPTADVSASSTTVNTGDTVDFDGSGSSDSDGSIDSYEWEFGDGSTATGSTASHSYSSSGDYTVTLTVTDDDGATDSASVTVTVESASGSYCGTASNSDHADNGRAYTSWGCYYAEGSGDYLGCMGSSSTTLKETSDGYYEEVSSC